MSEVCNKVYFITVGFKITFTQAWIYSGLFINVLKNNLLVVINSSEIFSIGVHNHFKYIYENNYLLQDCELSVSIFVNSKFYLHLLIKILSIESNNFFSSFCHDLSSMSSRKNVFFHGKLKCGLIKITSLNFSTRNHSITDGILAVPKK